MLAIARSCRNFRGTSSRDNFLFLRLPSDSAWGEALKPRTSLRDVCAGRARAHKERLVTSTSFDGLGLAEPLQLALKAENYLKPTPIQAKAIPLLNERKDLLG